MKKKFRSTLLILIGTITLSSVLTGCGGSDVDGSEIALSIDQGDINDKSFTQSAWEAIQQYGEDNEKTFAYYQADDLSDESIIANIELAISGGAEIIVTPGFSSAYAVFALQDKYPEVNFIMLDTEPADKDETVSISENTTCILYEEEEVGFLAGYAAVMDGYRNLGFMGGVAVTPVINFGYGFIDGAEYAAKELGLNSGDINIKYTYLGTYDASPETVTKASSWYNDGTEVIFACAAGAGASVMKAAETSGAKVIGVDVDQSIESDTVITSAMKNVKNSLYNTIGTVYDNSFNGGHASIFGTETGDVLLPIETSKFTNFTKDDYNQIYERIASKTVRISNSEMYASADKINLEITNVYVD